MTIKNTQQLSDTFLKYVSFCSGRTAVQDVLNDGLRTKDILSEGMKEVSTSQMGDAIISKLQ